VFRWLKNNFIEEHPNLHKWKVFLPGSNGSGAFGETLSSPLVGEPNVGITQTFISFGAFESKIEAENLLKYLKTKTCRALLSSLKVTQSNKNKEVWSNVPIQNFKENSDIDWSKSIPEIDSKLYEKYKLDKNEIDFIEKNVKPML
jgi:hypothetical protein